MLSSERTLSVSLSSELKTRISESLWGTVVNQFQRQLGQLEIASQKKKFPSCFKAVMLNC